MTKMRVTGDFCALVETKLDADEVDHEVRKCLHEAVSLLRQRGVVQVRKVEREQVSSGYVK